MMRDPSGDQSGLKSQPGSEVNRDAMLHRFRRSNVQLVSFIRIDRSEADHAGFRPPALHQEQEVPAIR
jgi:hypothetical protein